MVAADGAVVLNEVEHSRHLFEIGRNVRIVAPQMHVVENDVDNTFDLTARGIKLTPRGCGLRSGTEEDNAKRQWNRCAKRIFKKIFQSFHRSLLMSAQVMEWKKCAACLPTGGTIHCRLLRAVDA